MEIRKTELMPYAQFQPFMELYPETGEEEYQDLLMRMKAAKFKFDEEQKKFAEDQKKLEEENAKLKEEVKETKEVLESIPGIEEGTENLKESIQENIKEKLRIQNESKELDTEKEKLRKDKEDFKKKTLSGLLGKPSSKTTTEVMESDKDILNSVAESVYKRKDIVKCEAAKKAITSASNTLKMAAMML